MKESEIEELISEGSRANREGNGDLALEKYNQALAQAKQIDNKELLTRILNNIGLVLKFRGRLEEALQYFQQSLEISEQVDDKAGKGATLNRIGSVYEFRGRYEEALQYCQQALEISEQVDDKAGKGATLHSIGSVYESWGRYEEALQYFQQALAIAEQVDDMAGKVRTLHSIGGVNKSWGRYEEALKYHRQALEIAEQIEDVEEQGANLRSIGGVYVSCGRYEEALQYHQQALAIAEQVGDVAGKGRTLHSIGSVYNARRRREEAFQYFQQALEIAEQVGDVVGKSKALHSIGGVYGSWGKYDEAVPYFQQALAIAEQVGDLAGKSTALRRIGEVYQSWGQDNEAVQYYQQALEIAEQVGDVAGKSATLNRIGVVYILKRRFEEALHCLQQALKLTEQVGDMEWKGVTLQNLGRLYILQNNNYREAFPYYKQAIDLCEGLIGRIASEEIRRTYRGTQLSAYASIANLLLFWYRRDKDETHLAECLKYLELAKAREIIDRLEGRAVSMQTCPELAKLLQEEQKLVLEIEELYQVMKIERRQDKARSVSEGDLTEKGAQLRKLRAELMAKCKEQGLIRVTSEFDPIPDFQELFKREPVVLWEFISFPEMSEFDWFYRGKFWILSWDGAHMQLWETYNFDRKRLLDLLSRFYQNIANDKIDEARACLKDLQHDLDALIPEKALITLKRKKKLILIPQDVLHLFPWEITEKVGLKLPLVRSYSLSILRSCMKREAKSAPKSALLVSNPNFNDKDLNLHGADLEVDSIDQLFKKAQITTQPLKHETATEENFEKATGQALNIIHFAGHGIFNQVKNDPWMSGLLFYKSTGFDIRTVLELVTQRFKGTPLFVLSACETARGEFFTGDELVGLIRGLTLAGITSILATNWVLRDEVAPHFMQAFYTHFLKGKDACQSLFKARQDLIQQGFTHPFDWGVYALYGNPFKKFQE